MSTVSSDCGPLFAPPNRTASNQIEGVTLRDGDVSVRILNLGCITQDWRVPLAEKRVPVVLGYRDVESYQGNPLWMGGIVGRVANRIGGARFDLDEETYNLAANEGCNILHGGAQGLSRRIWAMERDGGKAVQLTLVSPDGEMGFPGRVHFRVTIRLEGARLHYEMEGFPDRPTPISLAQHSYYALAGGRDIGDHRLRIAASKYLPVDVAQIPLGRIESVDNHPFDFRDMHNVQSSDPANNGFDVGLVLDDCDGAPCAELQAPNGLTLKLWSDQPAMQLYLQHALTPKGAMNEGLAKAPLAAICLEPQLYTDAVNHPQFPSILATPERPYKQRLSVEIS